MYIFIHIYVNIYRRADRGALVTHAPPLPNTRVGTLRGRCWLHCRPHYVNLLGTPHILHACWPHYLRWDTFRGGGSAHIHSHTQTQTHAHILSLSLTLSLTHTHTNHHTH